MLPTVKDAFVAGAKRCPVQPPNGQHDSQLHGTTREHQNEAPSSINRGGRKRRRDHQCGAALQSEPARTPTNDVHQAQAETPQSDTRQIQRQRRVRQRTDAGREAHTHGHQKHRFGGMAKVLLEGTEPDDQRS